MSNPFAGTFAVRVAVITINLLSHIEKPGSLYGRAGYDYHPWAGRPSGKSSSR